MDTEEVTMAPGVLASSFEQGRVTIVPGVPSISSGQGRGHHGS